MSFLSHAVVVASSAEQPRLDDLLAQPGSWGREARALAAMARERGLRLDGGRLIYSDVRDLVTLQSRIRMAGPTRQAARRLHSELLCA